MRAKDIRAGIIENHYPAPGTVWFRRSCALNVARRGKGQLWLAFTVALLTVALVGAMVVLIVLRVN